MNDLDIAPISFNKIAVIIPAFNPDKCLVDLVKQLGLLGFTRIIVVNDGSNPTTLPIFNSLGNMSNVTVLKHAINFGKGRSLKTAFNHFLCYYSGFDGIVTADADGQHTADDVRKVAENLIQTNSVVLGSRIFNLGVPLRNKLGNVVTAYMFKFLLGKSISDTQTGLRGISTGILPKLLLIDGDRYEYETNMLIFLIQNGNNIHEVTIQTIYINDNRSSHFNPIMDSMRIYFVILRFLASSIITSIVDFVVFLVIYSIFNNLIIALAAGRTIAVMINFILNRNFVFNSICKPVAAFIRYIALVVLIAFISYLMII